MLIGYRRMSGAIGVSPQETGTRGMWWEKRLALVDYLEQLGHEVIFLSRPTQASQGRWPWPVPGVPRLDVLMVEFGGTNMRFFGDDIQETCRLIIGHAGPVVYLNDDPDLLFPWQGLPGEDWSRWKAWFNTPVPANLQRATGYYKNMPEAIEILDAPFGSLLPLRPAERATAPLPGLAYIGRPDGRRAALKALAPMAEYIYVYGRGKEWAKVPGYRLRGEPPPQPGRSDFYRQHAGVLALADAKHKNLGWRTGRAYHAVAAGVPPLVEKEHVVLASLFPAWSSPDEALGWLNHWRDPANRAKCWELAATAVLREKQRFSVALEKSGIV